MRARAVAVLAVAQLTVAMNKINEEFNESNRRLINLRQAVDERTSILFCTRVLTICFFASIIGRLC